MDRLIASTVRIAASLAMAAGIVAFADPALAQSPFEAPVAQVPVQTADLNLGSAAGRAVAERRIHAAASTVCATGGFDGLTDRGCMASALRTARQALDAQAAGTATLASN